MEYTTELRAGYQLGSPRQTIEEGQSLIHLQFKREPHYEITQILRSKQVAVDEACRLTSHVGIIIIFFLKKMMP